MGVPLSNNRALSWLASWVLPDFLSFSYDYLFLIYILWNLTNNKNTHEKQPNPKGFSIEKNP